MSVFHAGASHRHVASVLAGGWCDDKATLRHERPVRLISLASMKLAVGSLALVSGLVCVALQGCSTFEESDVPEGGVPDGGSSDVATVSPDAGSMQVVIHENARTAFVATDKGSVYWWSEASSEIRRFDKASPGTSITVLPRPGQSVTALAVDSSGIYWLETGADVADAGAIDNRIMRLATGSPIADALRASTEAMSLFALNNQFVVATRAGGIVGATKAGVAFDTGLGIDGRGLGADATNAYYTYLGGIFRFTPAANSSNVIQGLDNPTELVTDGDVLYAVTQSANGPSVVVRVDDSQSDQKVTSATTLTAISGGPLRLAVDNLGVVIMDGADGTIGRVSKTGGAVSTLVTGLNAPNAIAADANGVYWTSEAGDIGWLRR